MLELVTIKDNQTLEIQFPERVVSTNVADLKSHIFRSLEKIQSSEKLPHSVTLVFDLTLMIDSLGLNLLVSILEWAQDLNIAVIANIRNDLIFKTLDNVWLTQKMTVHRIET